MECVNWFIEGYRRLTGKMILPEHIGYEVVELAQEEIGHEFISEEDLKHLPDPLLVETCVYIDEIGNEWLAGLVICGDRKAGIYAFWTRNGESISRQFTNEWEGEE